MPAQYLFRLDDASPYMNSRKWEEFFTLFDAFHAKPIVAVIPFNRDPMLTHGPRNDLFWDSVREWQAKGYAIALHGYEHVYTTTKRGLVGVNDFSEFAGVSAELQATMLAEAYRKFEEEGVVPDIFVAPGHTFDENTLRALRSVTRIRYISDGFYRYPVERDGFRWIPQQLPHPTLKRKGVWTVCYHPETANAGEIRELQDFLSRHSDLVVGHAELRYDPLTWKDAVSNALSRGDRMVRRFLRTSVVRVRKT